MAIYHLNVQVISRGQGRSCVAAAAYRAGEKLEDERQGLTHDYTRRHDVRETWIQMPSSAPEWMADRQTLWTAIDGAEKRKDAQTAREVNIALPRELTLEQQRAVVREFVQTAFVERGMVADVAIHEGHNVQEPNPHAHILLTTRTLIAEGFGPKNREWNAKELLVAWRTQWEITGNEALEDARQTGRIDARSLADQGLDRVPTVHEGVAVRQMERRGIATDRGNINRAVREHAAVVVDLAAVRENRHALERQQEVQEAWSRARESAGWRRSYREWVTTQETYLGRIMTKQDVQQELTAVRQDVRLQVLADARAALGQVDEQLRQVWFQAGQARYCTEQGHFAEEALRRDYAGLRGWWARLRRDPHYLGLQTTIQQGKEASAEEARWRGVASQQRERVATAKARVEAALEAARPAQDTVRFFEGLLRQPWSREELQVAQRQQQWQRQQEAERQQQRQQDHEYER